MSEQQIQWTVIKPTPMYSDKIRDYPMLCLELLTDSERRYILRSKYFMDKWRFPEIKEFVVRNAEKTDAAWNAACRHFQHMMDTL